jgi:hypothetical protein
MRGRADGPKKVAGCKAWAQAWLAWRCRRVKRPSARVDQGPGSEACGKKDASIARDAPLDCVFHGLCWKSET